MKSRHQSPVRLATELVARGRIAGIVLAGAVLCSCSHAYQFTPQPSVSAISGNKLSGQSIAFDLTNVPESYQAKVQGQRFTMDGVRAYAKTVTGKLFANERVVEDASQAQAVLPSLQDGLHGCAASGRGTPASESGRDAVSDCGRASVADPEPAPAPASRWPESRGPAVAASDPLEPDVGSEARHPERTTWQSAATPNPRTPATKAEPPCRRFTTLCSNAPVILASCCCRTLRMPEPAAPVKGSAPHQPFLMSRSIRGPSF